MKKFLCFFLSFIFLSLNSACWADEGKLVSSANTSPNDTILVSKSQMPLSSRLSTQYTGYNFKISSMYPAPIYITNGEVQSSLSGQQAYLTVEKSSAAAVGAALGTGFVLGFVSLGITFLVAIVASPFIVIGNGHQNKKAKIESFTFSNQIPLGLLNQGDSVSVFALIPIGVTPQLKLTIQDTKTKQFFTLNK